jgi:hypothetical protein
VDPAYELCTTGTLSVPRSKSSASLAELAMRARAAGGRSS